MNNILTINGIVYNTKKEEDRRVIGNYFEKQLFKYLINNGVDVKYIAENNRFSLYDFIIEKDGSKYIVELKSRLLSLDKHNVELISTNKIEAFKKITKKCKDTKILFIFNHINSQDDYDFYYYLIDDYDKLNDICFLNMEYPKYTYELPIRYLKPLNEFI